MTLGCRADYPLIQFSPLCDSALIFCYTANALVRQGMREGVMGIAIPSRIFACIFHRSQA